MRHGLGLVTGLLTELMEAGAIPRQPVDAARPRRSSVRSTRPRCTSRSPTDPARARAEAGEVLRRLVAAVPRRRSEVDGSCEVTAWVVPLGRCAALHAEERHDSAAPPISAGVPK